MKLLFYISIFLSILVIITAKPFYQALYKYLKQGDINPNGFHRKFGIPSHDLYHVNPIYYQEQSYQRTPICLPQIWTCGPRLPPCCPGLICFDGNAKRGPHCVSKR